MTFFKQLLVRNELISMLYLDRMNIHKTFFLPTERHILTWKSNCNLKGHKICRKKSKMIQLNMKKRLLNWNEKVILRNLNKFLIDPLSSRIHWTNQQCETKTIPKSSIPVLEIIFWFKQDVVFRNRFRFVFFWIVRKIWFLENSNKTLC